MNRSYELREKELIEKLQNEADEFVEKVDEEIDAIKARKEKLRIALVKAGYDIPKGLTLEQWIPYIERGVRS